MQETGIIDSNTKKPNTSGGSRMQSKEESDDSYKLEKEIRCPCGSTSPSASPLVQVDLCLLFISLRYGSFDDPFGLALVCFGSDDTLS